MKKLERYKSMARTDHKYWQLFLVFTIFAFTGSAYAACADPVGSAGEREYFTDDHTYKFCDGTDWVSLSGGGEETPTDANFSSVVLLQHFDSDLSDSSNSNHTATANGNAAVSTTQKQFGAGATYFDGTGDYLSIPDSSNWTLSSGDWTIETWVRLDTLTNGASNYQCLFGQYQNDDNRWSVCYLGGGTPGTDEFFVSSVVGGSVTAAYGTGAQSIAINQWYHIAAVRSGTTTTIYVNGVAKSSSTVVYSDVSSPLYIGHGRYTGGNFDLKGYMDDVRITKGVARYTSGFTPPTETFPDSGGGGGGASCTPGSQVFTSSGTFTPEAGCTTFRVLVAGGGSGGMDHEARGGNGGAVETATYTDSEVTGPVTVTVGAGGSRAGWLAATGAGGASSFGALLSAVGGTSYSCYNCSTNSAGSGGGGPSSNGGTGGTAGAGGGGLAGTFDSLALFTEATITAGTGGTGGAYGGGSGGGGGGGGGVIINGSSVNGGNGTLTGGGTQGGYGGAGYGGGGGGGGYSMKAAGNGAAGVVYVEWE